MLNKKKPDVCIVIMQTIDLFLNERRDSLIGGTANN